MGGGHRRLHPVQHDRTADLDPVYVHLVLDSAPRNNNAADGHTRTPTATTPAAANFLFADGSVHFLKSSIAIKTYWALGTKANGEIISSDSY